jgi:hypothetical protein
MKRTCRVAGLMEQRMRTVDAAKGVDDPKVANRW